MEYQLLFERAPVPVLLLDMHSWRPIEFNNTAAELLGYERSEFALLTITDFELVPKPEETREHIAAIRRTGGDTFSAIHRAKDGSPRPVQVKLNVINWLGREAMLTVWHEDGARAPASAGGARTHVVPPSAEGLIARSPAMLEVLRLADRVAATDLPVLLLGETGTGKEVLARRLHARSRRAAGVFMPVNCGALPRDIADGELFGVERGAFTGADRRRLGRFEVADGGTVFLDEIGELEPALQVRLLRVLQEGEIHRLGAERPQRVDVRVIGATNRDLRAMVKRGEFREDLYYRLSGVNITLPPLRERAQDIRALVEAAHAAACSGEGRACEAFSEQDLRRLERSAWPGNIRELISVVRRAVALSEDGRPNLGAFECDQAAAPETRPVRLDAAIAAHLARTLETCGWAIEGPTGAAARLGVPASTLRSQMRRLGVRRPG